MNNFISTRENLLRRSTSFAHLAILEREFSEEQMSPINWAKIYLISKVSYHLSDIVDMFILARRSQTPKHILIATGAMIDSLFISYYETISKLVQGGQRDIFVESLNDIDIQKDVHFIRTMVVNDHIKRSLRTYDPQVDF